MVDVTREYRKLLRAAPSSQNLVRSLNLVRAIVQRSAQSPEQWDTDKLSFLWQMGPVESPELLALGRSRTSEFINSVLGEPSWERDTTREVVTTLFYASAFAREELEGEDFSFLADALLVVFHQSYFALLPKLTPRGSDAIALLRSYLLLAAIYQGEADFFRINGFVNAALGNSEQANKQFRAALRLVHSDEHDFMTRLQTVWMALLNDGKYAEAADLLAEMNPQITKENLGEFGELIRQTVEAAQAGRRPR